MKPIFEINTQLLYMHGWSILLGTFVFLYVFFALYVLVMGFYRAYLAKRLTVTTKVLAIPWIGVGFVVDLIANMTVATVVFLDLPQELLVTSRLDRYLHEEADSWRGQIASWVCVNLLDYFDPNGRHCR